MSEPLGVVQQVGLQQERLRARMETVRKKVAVVSGKGGVGKSFVAANLACLLSDLDVGILDADLDGPCLSRFLGIEPVLHSGSTDLIPASGPGKLRMASVDRFLGNQGEPLVWEGASEPAPVWGGALRQSITRELLADTEWGSLDLLLIDLPPSGEQLRNIAQLLPDLDGLIVVTTPAEVARGVVNRTISLAEALGIRIIGLVENMAYLVCPVCRTDLSPHGGVMDDLPAEFSMFPIAARIPLDPLVEQACKDGRPFVHAYPNSPTARALLSISETARQFLGLNSNNQGETA